MPEFFNVLPPEQAQTLMLRHITGVLSSQQIAINQALNRVTAEPIFSPHPLPAFRRSTMDGFAVHASDTFGANSSLPALLTVIGEVPMGKAAELPVQKGQAALVHTGGMIPDMVDAVVQIELTQSVALNELQEFPYEIEILRSVAAGENVLQIGEDIQVDEQVLPRGHLLRPQDIGGILALGITSIAVTRRPKVTILATGDEILPPESHTQPGQIRDINSYTIGALVQQAGGIAEVGEIVPDNFEALKNAAQIALNQSDMLVMSAGSSVSVRDMTVQVIEQLGKPGVLFHGVATRPGKPTIVGVIDGKPVLGLPGNPVSAMIQFDMFGIPAIYRLQGLIHWPRKGFVWARLSQNIASESGREDYVPARLEESNEGLIATPVFGKSNLIYTLVNADGLIKVPLNKGGLLAGEQVEVRLY